MTGTPAKRRAWFPRGAFEPSSQTRNKYLRGAWNKTARLEFGFYAKGPGKAQIALGVTRLAKAADVEVQRGRRSTSWPAWSRRRIAPCRRGWWPTS